MTDNDQLEMLAIAHGVQAKSSKIQEVLSEFIEVSKDNGGLVPLTTDAAEIIRLTMELQTRMIRTLIESNLMIADRVEKIVSRLEGK